MGKKNICVVFDMDDTLYLERDYAYSGFRAVGKWSAEQMGLNGVQEQAQELFDQGRRGDIFDATLERLGIVCDGKTISAMVRVYREHIPRIELLPDTLECLARLQEEVYLALLTDGSAISQWAKIDALGLRKQFCAIAVTGDWGIEYSKPHLKGYEYLESQVRPCHGHFVYVADNPSKDFYAPQTLGWNAIRVRRPAGLHVHKECSPDLVRFEATDLGSVPDLIAELYKMQI